MNKRFELVVIKLVCVDVNATDFTCYNFEENYLAIKDTLDEDQPYGIIDTKRADMVKILMTIKNANKIGSMHSWEDFVDVIWESKYDYKFKEVE